MNVIHSVEDNNSQIIHVSVNSNDRGATGEKGDSVTNLRITEENRLEATLSNGQTIDGGAVPVIKTRRVFVAEMDGVKRTYILPLNIESSQVSYILMNGVDYSYGYILQSGEITLNYDDLPAGRLEVVLNDNSGSGGASNTSINGKTGDIHLKTINGANLDGDGDIELATLDAFNNEARAREEADNNIRNSLSDHEARISNNESVISSHSNNLSSLNANISSVNNQMAVLADDVHEVTDNYVPKTRRINDKFLSHDMRLTADDVEALPITAGVTHPVRGELVVNGHITAENATQDNHVVTKAQLDAKVAEVVKSAPETLDTLEELSKALGDDPNFATTVANKIGTVDKKIDTEINKLANKVEINTENLKNTTQKANANSTNISLLNSTIATNKLSSDTQFSNVAKEQDEQNNLISDILNAFSKESEKGTNLKLSTSAAKVLGVTIYGNTKQKKYTGKNITSPLYFTTLWGTRTNTETGVIVKRGNSNKPSIGVYSIGQNSDVKLWNNIVAETDLVLSFSVRSLTSQQLNFTYRLEPLPANNLQLTTSWQKVVYKVQKSDARNFAAFIFYASNLDMTDPNCGFEIKDVQIEAGTEATDYEPFVGSTLPNGFSNLFDEFSNLPLSRDGITLSNQNGVLKLTGQPTADWIPLISRDITKLLQDRLVYTVAQYNVNGVKWYPEIICVGKDGVSSVSINRQDNKTFTFTADFSKYKEYRMKLQMGPKTSYTEPIAFYNNYALFVGNYNENNLPGYSPYNTGLSSPRPQLPQVVKELSGSNIKVVSRNLIKVKNLTSTQTQANTTVNPDNSITVQDENKNNWGMNITNDEACPLIEQGTKVTMSIDRPLPYKLILSCWANTGGPSFQFPLAIIDAGKTSATNVAQYTALSGHLLLSLSEIGKHLNETFKVQLEYGDIATEFAPYESSEFNLPSGLNLCYKLNDNVYDEVRLENGVAKLIKRVEKLELSGEEANLFLYRNTVSGTIGFAYNAEKNIFKQNKLITDIICSHFNSINEGNTWHGLLNNSGVSIFAGRENFPLSTNKIVFWFSLADAHSLKITDLASFKNWLKAEKAKGTPVTVYYEMKTPTEEEITDPALLAELKKLMGMRTYKDVTNISVTGNSLVPDIKVKFMRKIGE